MLKKINIKNFALIETLELSFHAGMTAITGETGSGKSILLDALGVVLGDKVEEEHIRANENEAEIIAEFDIHYMEFVHQWLEKNGFKKDNTCILKRILRRNKRSSTFIQNKAIAVTALQELGALLVDMHSQHAHQTLLRKDVQRQLLDEFGGYQESIYQVGRAYQTWQSIQQKLLKITQEQTEREKTQFWLEEEIKVFEKLALQEGEWELLQKEYQRLSHAEKLIQDGELILNNLYNKPENAYHLLQKSNDAINRIIEHDSSVQSSQELLQQAEILIQEAIDEVKTYVYRLELDPERLSYVEQRINSIQKLSYKHRVLPEELYDLYQNLIDKYNNLGKLDQDYEKLEQELEQAKKNYINQAQELTEHREQAAASFSQKITDTMQVLSLKGARLELVLLPQQEFSPYGLEKIEFLIQSNPGNPLKPLQKVASGGEISRISLAIYVISAQHSNIPTLVFDEVDTGIGGGTAEIVGQQLRLLGEKCQVFCVTHLAQVAAQSHQHLKISKQSFDNKTISQVEKLSSQERTQEIARMLGGIELTQQTLAHAEEMLSKAK